MAGNPPVSVLEDIQRSGGDAGLVHPEAVREHLRVLRVLARQLLAYLEDADDEAALLAAWSESPRPAAVLR